MRRFGLEGQVEIESCRGSGFAVWGLGFVGRAMPCHTGSHTTTPRTLPTCREANVESFSLSLSLSPSLSLAVALFLSPPSRSRQREPCPLRQTSRVRHPNAKVRTRFIQEVMANASLVYMLLSQPSEQDHIAFFRSWTRTGARRNRVVCGANQGN